MNQTIISLIVFGIAIAIAAVIIFLAKKEIKKGFGKK